MNIKDTKDALEQAQARTFVETESLKKEWNAKYGGYAFGPDSVMTLRDYFAAAALPAVIAFASQGHPGSPEPNDIPALAYGLADRMLAERSK